MMALAARPGPPWLPALPPAGCGWCSGLKPGRPAKQAAFSVPRKSESAVIDKTLTFREHFGDYQRQLFLMDHAGLPLKTVLEQLDLLGDVVPVLRRELGALPPATMPDGPELEGSRR